MMRKQKHMITSHEYVTLKKNVYIIGSKKYKLFVLGDGQGWRRPVLSRELQGWSDLVGKTCERGQRHVMERHHR
jgi:hypothetical protein